jgi:hypothetical protein
MSETQVTAQSAYSDRHRRGMSTKLEQMQATQETVHPGTGRRLREIEPYIPRSMQLWVRQVPTVNDGFVDRSRMCLNDAPPGGGMSKVFGRPAETARATVSH